MLPVELMVAGRVTPQVQSEFEQRTTGHAASGMIRFNWLGQVAAERIPEVDRSAHVLYSSDVNAACPNSVIEAMGCGLPVAAFDTGALPELVSPDAGVVVSYGSDPWKLGAPDIDTLAIGVKSILDDRLTYSDGARKRAEELFNLETMVDRYLEVLLSR